MMSASEPVPIQEYVVKVASRCNLDCDYCYVYTMADQSWRSRPVFPSAETIAATAARIGEHALAHRIPEVTIVLHGGEPLLAGPRRIDDLLHTLRRSCPAGTSMRVRMQTNGVLLDESWLPVLHRHRIRVGLSVDGNSWHNRHRVRHDGSRSHDDVVRATTFLRAHRDHYAGLLCVVDLDNDPLEVYESLLDHEPPAVDLLLPLGNWTAPPPRRANDATTPYADWLITVFNRWYAAPRRETGVRLFQEIIHLVLGGRSDSEHVGLSPVAFVVVDTDGSFQMTDTLKSAAPGCPETGLTVFDHPVDAVLNHPEVRARQAGLASLAQRCQRCPIVRVCGGGYYPHRYRAGAGFRNPSVYCPDLTRLIDHIARRVHTDLSLSSTR
jgi:uncharacterized protein